MASTNRMPRWGSLLLALTVAAAAASPQPSLAERDRQPKTETEGRGSSAPESLSKRLDQSDGVIRPPEAIDPDIHVPAPEPNPGTTPVIPPPGTPGGDPTVQPK